MSQYSTAKLCAALKENDLTAFVEALEDGTADGFQGTSWATCHSPALFVDDPNTSDALVYVQNIPSAIRDNPVYGLDLSEVYLGCTPDVDCPKDVLDVFPAARYIKTAPLSHQDAGARCVRAFANYLNTGEFLGFDPATPDSSTCQSGASPTPSTASPTSAPTSSPSSSPSAAPTNPPSPEVGLEPRFFVFHHDVHF